VFRVDSSRPVTVCFMVLVLLGLIGDRGACVHDIYTGGLRKLIQVGSNKFAR
jgi:hypothetical protein